MPGMNLSETSFGLPKLLRSSLTEKHPEEPETRRAVHRPTAHSRKGFFKSFSKTIGNNKEGRCFRDYSVVSTPTYLLLEYRLYWEDRKEIQRQIGSSLSLEKLFCTKKGREALLLFLSKTKIATKKWLIAEESLKGGNSYYIPSK